jgi:phage N-6-adenine-methyltransferase
MKGSTTSTDARDEWRTPPWLFEWLDNRFDFEIDLAATYKNTLCPRFYSESDNALLIDWYDHNSATRGWVNPPYSNIDPWVHKAIAEMAAGFLTVMLFPSPNGEDRFDRVFRHATEVIDIVGRIAFLRPDGAPVSGNTRGSSVYIFDPALRGAPCRRWWVLRDEIRARYE